MSCPRETKSRLIAWGRWASGAIPGFPIMAAFMRANCGGRATAINQANPELLRTDQIIARLELKLRKVIIRHYCTQGSGREKALRMGIPKSTYWQRLDEGTWFVHTEFDKPDTAIRESQFVHSESRIA
jgi:hypothetical protein